MSDPLSEAIEALHWMHGGVHALKYLDLTDEQRAAFIDELIETPRDLLARLDALPAPVRMARASRDAWVPAAAGGKAWLYLDAPNADSQPQPQK